MLVKSYKIIIIIIIIIIITIIIIIITQQRFKLRFEYSKKMSI